MKRTLRLSVFISLAVLAGCSANAGKNNAAGAGDGEGGSPSAGEGGGLIDTGDDSDGAGGLFGGGEQPGNGTGSGTDDCVASGDEDKDKDGFSVNQGDCNDCDANVNPGAVEVIVTEPNMDGDIPTPADEDCDKQIDNVAEACDSGLTLTDTDPLAAARALDLCQLASPGDTKWGVLKADYVRADGSAGVPPSPLQYGIMDGFGPNVNPQRGERMFVLSSGHARIPGQPDACGSLSCTSNFPGTPPAGFPQDVPHCPGAKDINDDVALQLRIRAPKNATGYSFSFKFYSFEYPEWVCTSFNDQYITLVDPPPQGSIGGNISFDSKANPVSVNVAFFDVCPDPQCALGAAELAGTGFDDWDDAGGTGWLKTQAPIEGGAELEIRFAIWDTGDSSWDSTAIIDNFQWVANGGQVVVGTEEIPDPK